MVYAWGEMGYPSWLTKAREAQEAGVMNREEKLFQPTFPLVPQVPGGKPAETE